MDGIQHRATIDWTDTTVARESLLREAGLFAASVSGDDQWTIVWAAGKTVVSSDASEIDGEISMLSALFEGLEGSSLVPSAGHIAFTSSAGAVYAGGSNPPFDESSPVHATSEYGQGKLIQEELIRAFSESTGVRASIARVASVYGPRQDLGKAQGLISHLCRAAIAERPAEIFVPLETRRHYVFADDVGRKVGQLLSADISDAPLVTIKNVYSGPALGIREVVQCVEAAHGRQIELSVRPGDGGRRYPPDVTLRSSSEPRFEHTDDVPLSLGVAITYAATRVLHEART